MSKQTLWQQLKALFKTPPPRPPSQPDSSPSHSSSVTSQLDAAAAYQSSGQLNAAAEIYHQLLRHYPEKSWWYNKSLWEVLESTESLQTAIAILEEFSQQSTPVKPAICLNLAEALTCQGEYEAAMTHYQAASYAKFSQSYSQLVKTAWTEQPLSPNFIIIGAAKSGTSALYSYLASHPKILPAVVKEINFWSYRFSKGLPWYLSHFPGISEAIAAQQGIITGEASPSYLAHPDAAQRLKQAFPNIRLLVSLRHPVERTISHYYDRVRRHQEVRPLEVAISQSLAGEFTNSSEAKLAQNYLQESRYSENLKSWYGQFSPEQIHVIKSEDLLAQPAATSQSVFSYLELPQHQLRQYQNYNVGHYDQSGSTAQIKTQLMNYFQDDIEQLEDIIGVSLSW